MLTIPLAEHCDVYRSEFEHQDSEAESEEEEEDEECDHYGPSYSKEEDGSDRDTNGHDSDNVRRKTSLCFAVTCCVSLVLEWGLAPHPAFIHRFIHSTC